MGRFKGSAELFAPRESEDDKPDERSEPEATEEVVPEYGGD